MHSPATTAPAAAAASPSDACGDDKRTGAEPDLSVDLAGVRLRNPVIAASGTFGYGREYSGLLDIGALGGICTKGLTLEARPGNRGIRLHETPAGLMNSIGLENPGIPAFLEKELPALRALGPAVIANLSGSTIEDYRAGAELLGASDIDMVELNISCPNVKAGGMAFGLCPADAASVVRAVRRALEEAAPRRDGRRLRDAADSGGAGGRGGSGGARVPLMVKLSPNAADLPAVARACADEGADALSLVNTFKALAIDIRRRTPVFDNLTAGLSGPAIKPIALRMVWEVCAAVSIPVVGMGGIGTAEDALEFLMAGAAAVQVGAATFQRPCAMTEIIEGIRRYMAEEGIASLSELSINGVKK